MVIEAMAIRASLFHVSFILATPPLLACGTAWPRCDTHGSRSTHNPWLLQVLARGFNDAPVTTMSDDIRTAKVSGACPPFDETRIGTGANGIKRRGHVRVTPPLRCPPEGISVPVPRTRSRASSKS